MKKSIDTIDRAGVRESCLVSWLIEEIQLAVRLHSDVVRSLISRMFRFGIANGHDAIEYNPASGTERALDTLPKRTRYPDDHNATKRGEFKRLWAVWNDRIATGRPLLGWNGKKWGWPREAISDFETPISSRSVVRTRWAAVLFRPAPHPVPLGSAIS